VDFQQIVEKFSRIIMEWRGIRWNKIVIKWNKFYFWILFD